MKIIGIYSLITVLLSNSLIYRDNTEKADTKRSGYNCLFVGHSYFIPVAQVFNKIPENGFRVQCDYKQTEDNNLEYLIPKIIEKPEIIHDVKIVPNKIEFLIKK